MSVTSKTGGKDWNNLFYILDNPKQFVETFWENTSPFKTYQIRGILVRICALRNSGGGRLTIWFTQTCSKSEVEKYMDLITKAVNEVLSDTGKVDLLEWKFSASRIVFLISCSKEIVTMKCNMYDMKNEKPYLIPSKRFAAEIRDFLQGRKKVEGQPTVGPKKIFVDRHEFVKGEKVEVRTSETVKIIEYRKQRKGTEFHVHDLQYLNRSLAYVSAFANCRGGEVYYGISSNGTVRGVSIGDIDVKDAPEIMKRFIAKEMHIVRSQPNDKSVESDKRDEIDELLKITLLPVTGEDLYVVEISVSPCKSRAAVVGNLESYHVVENRAEKLPFYTWIQWFQHSTTEELHNKAKRVEFKEGDKAFDRLFLPDDYETLLKGLDWVESFEIVDENEECDARHLEIVCKLGKVPRTADIVKCFGEEILPFITYQERSKRKWFEANIFDENCGIKKEHEDSLRGLSWVADYYVGVAKKPEKSWQMYITYAENTTPSMVELKKLFGVNIAYFVDFIQGNKDRKEPRFLGPVSGDELCVQQNNDLFSSGTIGILNAADNNLYATTCYHSCFKGD